MINFEYIALFLCAAITAICAIIIITSIRYKHLFKLCRLYILRRQQKKEISFYSDIVLRKCLRKLFFSPSKEAKNALVNLIFGRTSSAVEIISKTDKSLALFLKAHTDPKSAYSQLKKNPDLYKRHYLYRWLTAILAAKFFDYAKTTSLIKNIETKKLHGVSKAYYNQISALVYIHEADMLSASCNASLAMKFFQKHDMLIEEAETYLLLGEIYRISCVHDVSQTMIESALKIYNQFKLQLFKARASAVLGMLMVYENRLDEAEDKFNSALDNLQMPQTKADILNQVALLEIARNNIKKSLVSAKEALELHGVVKNDRGIGLSSQILAHLYVYEHKFKKALDYCEQALIIYTKQKNFSALCETMYLQSTIFFKQNKFKKSEQLLRNILQIAEKHTCNFHHANAYSLLGLIYLKKNDLQRAKVLFQQSLHLEQRNNRANGMVADYVNLSLIESMRGDLASADNNLKAAMEYAIKTGDENLINLIKNRM